MSTRLGRWSVAARLARREVRRHPWRHVLVIALIFVPTAASLAAFSTIATLERVTAMAQDIQWADADLIALPSGDEAPLTDDQRDQLPPGSTVEQRWTTGDWLVTAQQRRDGLGPRLAGTELTSVPVGGHLADAYDVTAGRRPAKADEALVTEALAQRAGTGLGQQIESARTGERFTVVGLGRARQRLDGHEVLLGGTEPTAWTSGQPMGWWVDAGPGGGASTRVEQSAAIWLPPGASAPDLGGDIGPPATVLRVTGRFAPLLTVAAGALAALVAVVASAAFSIASRRQLRTVGLLACAGTDPATVRASLVLQGTMPGLAAGILALLAGGMATIVLGRSHLLEHWTQLAGATVAVSPFGVLVSVGVGVMAGTLAAWQPSRTATRAPLLSALAGRRPLGPVPTRVPVMGVALWLVGVVLVIVGLRVGVRRGVGESLAPTVVLVGVLALGLGGLGLAPAAVATLGRLADRTRGMVRLALRSLARDRTQSAATIGAVAMALALPIGVLTASAGARADLQRGLGASADRVVDARRTVPADQAELAVRISGPLRSTAAHQLVDRVVDVLGPSSTVVRTLPIADQRGTWRLVAVVDERAARDVLAPWAAAAIRRGEAVPIGTTDAGDRVRFTVASDTKVFPIAAIPAHGVATLRFGEAAFLVGADALAPVGRERPPDAIEVLRRRGLTADEATALAALGAPLTTDGVDQEGPTLASVRDHDPAASTAAATGPDALHLDLTTRAPVARASTEGSGGATTALLVVALAATVVAVAVLGITLALRAVDRGLDRAAAVAAGATPAQLARQRAIEGFVLAITGALLALPLGWLTVMAVRFGEVRGSTPGGGHPILDRLVLPGWPAVPVLMAPAVVVGLGWWAVPAIRARLRRVPTDELLPRW